MGESLLLLGPTLRLLAGATTERPGCYLGGGLATIGAAGATDCWLGFGLIDNMCGTSDQHGNGVHRKEAESNFY